MDTTECLVFYGIASGVKLAIIGGLVENVHTLPYIGRFLDVVASAACKGVPFSVMGRLLWELRWPNIKTLDQLFPPTFKEQQENDLFTGRPRCIDVDWFRKALQSRRCTRIYKSETVGFYKYIPDFIRRRLEPRNVLPVYIYDDGSRFPVVIKKISYSSKKQQKEKEMKESAISEILAGSLRHYAVLPLIANAEDKEEKQYYLMFPYMKKKDLRHNINADNERIEKGETVMMDEECRVKILYHILCSMVFLHKEVHNFRGAVSHGDITTANILIDENDDARLADFGQSRFYRHGEKGIENPFLYVIGTPGYYRESRRDFLNTETDILYFGIVVLEMLTGCSPYDEGNNRMPLLEDDLDTLKEDYKTRIDAVWKAGTRREELFSLADQCRKGDIEDEKQIKKIWEKLDHLYNNCPTIVPTKGKVCRLCMVTEKMKDSKMLGHEGTCGSLQICMNCVKNSHLNPLGCHACQHEVTSPIGHNWGAICVAGYDEDSSISKMFERDARAIYNMCLSKMPLSIGIREENAHVAFSIQEVRESISSLQQCHISTLFVFYSGHFDPHEGFLLQQEQEQRLKQTDLNKMLSELTCEKIVSIYDCCSAPDIRQMLQRQQTVIFQLRACYPDQQVPIPDDRSRLSIFTKLVIEALNGRSKQCEYCKTNETDLCSSSSSDTGFVCIEQLRNYMADHYRDMYERECEKSDGRQLFRCDPSTNNHGDVSSLNNKVAFYQRDCSSVKFHVSLDGDDNFIIEVPQLERNMDMLMAELMLTVRANCGIPDSITDEVLQVAVFPDVKCTMLTSIEQIENAHATNQDMFVQLRRADNIHHGKILISKERSDRIFLILQRWSMEMGGKMMNEIFLLMRVEKDTLGENKLFINLRDNGVRNMRNFIREKSNALSDFRDRDILKYFKNKVLKLALVSKIQQNGMLVVCFPVQQAEDEETAEMNSSLFTVYWEPAKFNIFDYIKFQNSLTGIDWYDKTICNEYMGMINGGAEEIGRVLAQIADRLDMLVSFNIRTTFTHDDIEEKLERWT